MEPNTKTQPNPLVSTLIQTMRGNLDCQKDALGRPELSATPSGNVRSLRSTDGWSRREADISDGGFRPFKCASAAARGWGSQKAERSGGAHSSGSPALIRASRKPGGESIKPGWSACNDATESLGFNFIASANAAFASGALSAAA